MPSSHDVKMGASQHSESPIFFPARGNELALVAADVAVVAADVAVVAADLEVEEPQPVRVPTASAAAATTTTIWVRKRHHMNGFVTAFSSSARDPAPLWRPKYWRNYTYLH